MKNLFFLSAVALSAFVISAFSPAGTGLQDPKHPKVTTKHPPLYATFDNDSFYCDPAEAKHQGRVHYRFNTLHMKEKGEDNIIVHFKSKKYTGAKGKPENDYVHFDILYKGAEPGKREDTHLTLTWKGKKYHVKGNQCDFEITKVTWDENKHHFTFSGNFSARVVGGGTDTTSHIFKGLIVDEVVKAKTEQPHGTHHK